MQHGIRAFAIVSISALALAAHRAEAQSAADTDSYAAESLDTIPVNVDDAKPEMVSAPERSRQNIAEVIVTAQRREQRLQDVPISITVLDQEQLTNGNVTNSADLARYTPSLSTNSRFGSENATFAIRGFTQDFRTTPSVATYFAEVVAPRGQSSQSSGDGAGPGTLFDLQNVQVLKGPQGTLFGRNSTGGAILLVPQKPKDQFEGYGEVTAGDFGAIRGQAVINSPLSEDFRVRLGVDRNRRDGYLDNVSDVGARNLGDTNYTAARLSAVWNITDSIENYSIISMVNSDTKGYTQGLYACNNPLTRLADPSNIDVQALIRGLADTLANGTIDLTDPVPGIPIGSPFALLTFAPCEQQLKDQKAAGKGGFYDFSSTIKTPVTEIKERRFINTTSWTISDQLSLKNIFAYAHLYTLNASDVFGTRFPDPLDSSREFMLSQTVNHPDIPLTSQETWVEEVQLQGSAFDARLNYQGGIYFERSDPDGPSGSHSAYYLYCDLASLEGDPSQFRCFDPLAGVLGAAYRYQVETHYLNKAVYMQGTYEISDAFSATLGLRYTSDETRARGEKEIYRYLLAVPMAPQITVQTPEIKSNAPTGIVEVDYRPWEETMVYAKYTRGYRQGNTNTLADPGLDTHKAETVDTYELGFKSSFRWLISGRVNAAVFHNRLTDMQLQGGYISRTSGPTTAIFNAGEAESKGFEVESFFQLLEPLTLGLSYSYLDTKLIKSAPFCSRVNQVGLLEGLSCTPIAEVGDSLPFAPRSSLVVNGNLDLPIPGEYGRLALGVTYAYTGEQRAAASTATPYAILDGFGLLNANLSWTSIMNSGCDLTVFGSNLTDEEYVTFTSGTYKPLGVESRAVGLPRMLGARLRFNF